MAKSRNASTSKTTSDHGRREFVSRSFLAGSALLLAAESHGYAHSNQENDAVILRDVSAADSLALYTNLLDEVRRLVLQKDAKMIYVAKYEATTWLAETTSNAKRLSSLLAEGATLADRDKGELRNFLSQVVYGGDEISRGLIRMRQQPLEEIKRLDTDFDKIRADLTAASNAIKNRNPGLAKEGIASALSKLNKYSTSEIEGVSKALEQEYQITLISPSRLQKLLQTVLDSLDPASSPRPAELNHSRGPATRVNYNSPVIVEPALQGSITGVLRAKLKPSSWLQVGIGYAVTFPILMRVSDKDNRIKLLNDALRLVPPGLRNPLLLELASDLANLN